MLARKNMPAEFLRWNRAWGAPFGFDRWWRRLLLRVAPSRMRPHLSGPFGFQPGNCETRAFEYPWAYHATPLSEGLEVVEVGGGLAGFQFVLARHGANVVNVDPGESAVMGWPLDVATFRTLNRAFGTDVRLRKSFLHEAEIPSGSVDRVFSISTLEHVPESELPAIVAEIRRILRPGGLCVLTIDLFLDLDPFTSRRFNDSGRNVDVASLVSASGLELIQGDRCELHGFADFDPRRILSNLSEYLYGTRVPALAQTLVLGKSAAAG